MLPLVAMIVAVEMLLLPPWVGAAMVGPPESAGLRLARAPAPVVLAAGVLVVLAAVAGEGLVALVVRTQAVAVGFLVLLAGVALLVERLAGARPAQAATALVGWAILAGVVLAGPVVEMVGPPAKAAVVRAVVHANPLVVAAQELDLKWLHQALSYRLTPIGESYGYLFGGPAWWKTLLGHVFVGSGLLVFSVRRARVRAPAA